MDKDGRQAGAVIVTPEMLREGRNAFNRWMSEWDYSADGLPGDDDVEALLASVYSAMGAKKPAASK